MARKEKVVTIQDGEQELTFRIRQMSARSLFRWKGKALLLLAGAGVKVPEGANLTQAGAFLANGNLAAVFGSLDYDSQIEPMLDELLECCSRQVENVYEQCSMQSVDGYFQTDSALFRLCVASAELNLGFTVPEPESSSGFPWSPATATP